MLALHCEFPTALSGKSKGKSLQNIDRLKDGGLYRITNEDTRLLVDEAHSALTSMNSGEAPEFKSSPVAELQKIYNALPTFLRVKGDDGSEVVWANRLGKA